MLSRVCVVIEIRESGEVSKVRTIIYDRLNATFEFLVICVNCVEACNKTEPSGDHATLWRSGLPESQPGELTWKQ